MILLALATNVTPIEDLDRTFHQSTAVVTEPEKLEMHVAGTPHGPIVIDGDANFSDTALLEGWPGDGSSGNPFIIDGLDIDNTALDFQQMFSLGITSCIEIRNTRVSFTISNCNLSGFYVTSINSRNVSGLIGVGIHLQNVYNGELINNWCTRNGQSGINLLESDFNIVSNNTCNNNKNGIYLSSSDSNTVVNNTCTSNKDDGICLEGSNSNTVSDNTCSSNGESGIYILWSAYNTLSNNICNTNTNDGISLEGPKSNTVSDNTCTSNGESGIYLRESDFNIVSNNTCNNNRIGIYLYNSDSNSVIHNTCTSNKDEGICLHYSGFNNMADNTCTSNIYGISLAGSASNTLSNNICNKNENGIYIHRSDSNMVVNNTCINNTEHDIYLYFSNNNTVENNITTSTYYVIFLQGWVLVLLTLSIVVLGSRWHQTLAIIQRTRLRLVFWFRKRKGDQDTIIVPIRYRLLSWFRKRRSLKLTDVDEHHEPDSLDE